MNDFQEYIYEVLKMNPKNGINIKWEKFINNSTIKKISLKYKYNSENLKKFYNFTLSLIKTSNENLKKYSCLDVVKKPYFSINIFNGIKLTYHENIQYLANMYNNYFTRIFKYEEFIFLVEKLYKFNEKVIPKYIFVEREDAVLVKDKNNNFKSKKVQNVHVIDDLGKFLYTQDLAETFQADDKYVLNDFGKKFYKLICMSSTKKEKEVSSRLVSLKRMSKMTGVKKHEKYYKNVFSRIGKNELFRNIATKREGAFKYFFDEYKVLIDYAIAEYGYGCKIRFCGNKTNKKNDYDGVIKIGKNKEKIQITTISHNEEEKKLKENLLNYGWSIHRVSQIEESKKKVLDLVSNAIEKKESKLKDKVKINLLILVDCFEEFALEDIKNKKEFEAIFIKLRNRKYKFKKIDIIVAGYKSDIEYLEPWVIKIK